MGAGGSAPPTHHLEFLDGGRHDQLSVRIRDVATPPLPPDVRRRGGPRPDATGPERPARTLGGAPAGQSSKRHLVVWQYGNIYQQIAQQFEQDWSVKVNQIIEPNIEPQVAKLTAMYAAGEAVDVSQSPIQYLSSYIEQGIAQPIDGLPGVEQYVKDFTPFTRATAQRDGKRLGPALLLDVLDLHLQRRAAGQGWIQGQAVQELSGAARAGAKGEEGRRRQYPILWIGGVGFEQLPGTWFSLTYNRGGTIFDKQLTPQLGPGSVARETLKWWQGTFKEELADPNSLNLRFIPAVKAFNAGRHVYLGTRHPLREPR